MKAIQFIKQRVWLLAIFIFVLAFGLRLLAALKMAWWPSEINYVDWAGQWFAQHFWQYLFQFSHKISPPDVGAFGNPPFAMWLLSSGIYVATKLHFSVLIGARMINVFLGSITAVYLFYFGKKWFSLLVGLLAALSFVFIPVIVTNNASAYLDTLLAFLVLMALDLTYRYFQDRKPLYLYLLGLVLGLCLLTKFVIIPIIFVIWVMVIIVLIRNRKFKYLTFFLIITIFVPFLLWSGLRDPQQIKDLFFVYKNNIYNPYPIKYPTPIFLYYYLMILGILPPIVLIGGLYEVILLIKNIIKSNWKKFRREILILILIIVFITFNTFFARYTTTHQLITILPLMLILVALGFEHLFSYVRDRRLKLVIFLIILFSLITPLFSFKPEFWGLYSSSFVGGADTSFKLYGGELDGSGVPEVAKFLKENTPEDSRIAVVDYDWLFPKYDKERNYPPIFLDDGLIGAYSRGFEYVVIPRVYLEVKSQTQADFSKLEPIFTFKVKNIVLAKVYKIDYSKIQTVDNIPLGSQYSWGIESENNSPIYNVESGELKIDYQFEKSFPDYTPEDNRFILTQKKDFDLTKASGIYFEAYGDGEEKL